MVINFMSIDMLQEAAIARLRLNTGPLQAPVTVESYIPSVITTPPHITYSYIYNLYAKSFL
mgnify:CR=1 FL=1|jgi:hypothetical protein